MMMMMKVTAGPVKSNGSLSLGLWLRSPAGSLCQRLCLTFEYGPPLSFTIVLCLNVQSCKLFATVFSSIKTPTACQVYRLDTATLPFTISATCVSIIQQPSGLSNSVLWNLIGMVIGDWCCNWRLWMPPSWFKGRIWCATLLLSIGTVLTSLCLKIVRPVHPWC